VVAEAHLLLEETLAVGGCVGWWVAVPACLLTAC
jgi:hypothetical protein